GVISPETADCLMRGPARCAEKGVEFACIRRRSRSLCCVLFTLSPSRPSAGLGQQSNHPRAPGASAGRGADGSHQKEESMLGNLWRKLNAAFSRGRRPKGKPSRPDRFRPTVEALEDKALPSISLTMFLPDGSHLRNGEAIPVEFAAGRPDPVTGRRPFDNESPRLVIVGPE